jgi:hypothetical protein
VNKDTRCAPALCRGGKHFLGHSLFPTQDSGLKKLYTEKLTGCDAFFRYSIHDIQNAFHFVLLGRLISDGCVDVKFERCD